EDDRCPNWSFSSLPRLPSCSPCCWLTCRCAFCWPRWLRKLPRLSAISFNVNEIDGRPPVKRRSGANRPSLYLPEWSVSLAANKAATGVTRLSLPRRRASYHSPVCDSSTLIEEDSSS